ncbi:MAG: hypothetical protein IJL56_08275 [Bacteroidales bacterium]|nr:hypothetical protein [Bacteroidales bacterium]
MRRLYFIIAVLLFPLILQAQPKEVSLIVTGEGATKEEATNNALRSAVEQAFGVFVSANTEILNDELIKDEIATISSGNIKSFKEISYNDNLGNNLKSITLNTVVSIGKLIEYSKSHGSKAEFSGAVFGANLRLREQKSINEPIILKNLLRGLTRHGDLFNATIQITGHPFVGEVKIVPFKDEVDESIHADGCGENVLYRYYSYSDEVDGVIKKRRIYYPISIVPKKEVNIESTYFLPIKISFDATPYAVSVFKEFDNALSLLSLTKNECDEYDAEGIPYYGVKINNRIVFLRDYYSALLIGDLIAILNKYLYKDWTISLTQTDGTVFQWTGKVENKYNFKIGDMGYFTADYYYIGRTAQQLYSYKALQGFRTGSFSIPIYFSPEKGFYSYGKEDSVEDGFNGRVVEGGLQSDFRSFEVWKEEGNTKYIVISAPLKGRLFRVPAKQVFYHDAIDYNYVLFPQNKQEPIELLQAKIPLNKAETPLNESDLNMFKNLYGFLYGLTIASPLYERVCSGETNNVLEYEFNLPISKARLEQMTSIEIGHMSVNK